MQAALDGDIDAIVGRKLDWDRLSNCRVVVTGGGGFLGSYLVRTLLQLHAQGRVAQPVRVIALVRDLDRARERFADLSANGSLELMRWDLNAIAVPNLGDVHYIFHAASQASPRHYGSDPVGTLVPNAVGTLALLEALRAASDPRGLLFVSSSEVYGSVAAETALDERTYGSVDPATVRACYAESKRLGETACVAWHHQYALPTYIVRPFHTYGPGLRAEDGRVFADFAFNVIRHQNIVMNSDGSARRAFCYVSDAVAGFFTVLLNGNAAQPYNVANPDGELSVMELADLVVALFPDRHLQVERRFVQDQARYIPSTYNRLVPDVTSLRELGWQAEVSPREGFKRMIEAYQ